MARKSRDEYEEPLYHVMNRGDRQEPICLDDRNAREFVKTLGEVFSESTAWRLPAEDGQAAGKIPAQITANIWGVTVHRAGRREGWEFPYLMARWIGIHSTEFLTTPSARLGLEPDHLIALTGRNQITIIRTRGHFASGLHPKGLRLRVPEERTNSLTHPVNGYIWGNQGAWRYDIYECAGCIA